MMIIAGGGGMVALTARPLASHSLRLGATAAPAAANRGILPPRDPPRITVEARRRRLLVQRCGIAIPAKRHVSHARTSSPAARASALHGVGGGSGGRGNVDYPDHQITDENFKALDQHDKAPLVMAKPAEDAAAAVAPSAAAAGVAVAAPGEAELEAAAEPFSILVRGLEGRSWAEKAQRARKLLSGLLTLSRPHNFLPSMFLVILGAFLASSGNTITTTTAVVATPAAVATASTAAATAASAGLPVWLSPRVLLVAGISGLISLASMIVNDVFDWQIGSDRVNAPDKPLVSGAVHPHDVSTSNGPSALSGLISSLASMIVNDVFDWQKGSDKVNAPDKPLISGAVHPHDAELAAGCLYSLIVLAACHLEPAPLRMLVAGAAVATYVYTPLLKRITLVKNVVVAGIIASSLLAGALAAGGAFLFLFQALVYREVLMDVADVSGDASAGVPTLAVRLGKQRAVLVACGMLVLAHGAGAFLSRRSPVLVLAASICLLPLYTLTLPLLHHHTRHTGFQLPWIANKQSGSVASSQLQASKGEGEQDVFSSIVLQPTGAGRPEGLTGDSRSQAGGVDEREEIEERKKLDRVIDISMTYIGAALLSFSAATVGLFPMFA